MTFITTQSILEAVELLQNLKETPHIVNFEASKKTIDKIRQQCTTITDDRSVALLYGIIIKENNRQQYGQLKINYDDSTYHIINLLK